jgi:hypothetical protein
VRTNICTAYVGLVQVFLDTTQPALAEQTKQNALKNYSCPPESFNRLEPDTTTTPPPK